MEDIFIKSIEIKKVRHLKNLTILLDEHKRKHLILTGRNGSGKTSVLLEIKNWLQQNLKGGGLTIDNDLKVIELWEKEKREAETHLLTVIDEKEKIALQNKIHQKENIIAGTLKRLEPFLNAPINIKLNIGSSAIIASQYKENKFLLTYFDVKRLSDFSKSLGPRKIEFKQQYNFDEKVNLNFIQYLVNLRYDRLDARESNELDTVQKVDNWFANFEKSLKDIFEDDALQLVFDRRNYNFNLVLSDRETFDFNTLSSGYSAIIHILTELIMRMEHSQCAAYDMQGIVLIDEIETHLHIELQKKVLPFLTNFFPNIQFIVTTHSPFVLNSVEDAIVFDLEKQERLENDKKH